MFGRRRRKIRSQNKINTNSYGSNESEKKLSKSEMSPEHYKNTVRQFYETMIKTDSGIVGLFGSHSGEVLLEYFENVSSSQALYSYSRYTCNYKNCDSGLIYAIATSLKNDIAKYISSGTLKERQYLELIKSDLDTLLYLYANNPIYLIEGCNGYMYSKYNHPPIDCNWRWYTTKKLSNNDRLNKCITLITKILTEFHAYTFKEVLILVIPVRKEQITNLFFRELNFIKHPSIIYVLVSQDSYEDIKDKLEQEDCLSLLDIFDFD